MCSSTRLADLLTVFSILQLLLSDHPVFQRSEGMVFCSAFQPHSSHKHFFDLIIEDILQMDKALFKQHTYTGHCDISVVSTFPLHCFVKAGEIYFLDFSG